MKTLKNGKGMLSALVVTAAVAVSGAASSGEPSPEFRALRASSAARILDGRTLPVYRKMPGPGNAAAVERALQVLNNTRFAIGSTPPDRRVEAESVFLKTDAWMLHVTGEGRRIRLWVNQRNSPDDPPSARLSYDAVMQAAKRLLENELSPLVPLAANERLVPRARHDCLMGFATIERIVREDVVQSFAHFGRSIDGVTVVGPGAKAVVVLDNAGGLAGFDLDWSEYEPTGASQKTLSVSEMAARLAALDQAGALPGPANRRLRHVECGYYDRGSLDGITTDLIQPGCVYEFELLKDGRTMGLLPVNTPAGEQFTREATWPEAVLLANGG